MFLFVYTVKVNGDQNCLDPIDFHWMHKKFLCIYLSIDLSAFLSIYLLFCLSSFKNLTETSFFFFFT